MLKTAILSSWLLLASVLPARAADTLHVTVSGTDQWRVFSHPDRNLSLPYEARDGSLWCKVTDGVARHDGTVWTVYTSVDGLMDGPVGGIVQTADGVLWFAGSHGERAAISRYDGAAGLYSPGGSARRKISTPWGR